MKYHVDYHCGKIEHLEKQIVYVKWFEGVNKDKV